MYLLPGGLNSVPQACNHSVQMLTLLAIKNHEWNSDPFAGIQKCLESCKIHLGGLPWQLASVDLEEVGTLRQHGWGTGREFHFHAWKHIFLGRETRLVVSFELLLIHPWLFRQILKKEYDLPVCGNVFKEGLSQLLIMTVIGRNAFKTDLCQLVLK